MSLAFPFRFDRTTGNAVTVEPGSNEEIEQSIALHILTRTGERPLRPDFGTESLPYGDGLQVGSLQLQLNEHGWKHISIESIDNDIISTNTVESAVNWKRNS